jgi:pimeloyl-ACP methyl ester carboxylesterase
VRDFDASGLLARVRARTPSLGAHQDVMALAAGAEQLTAAIAQAELVMVEGGHDVTAENPGVVAEVLRGFLAGD